MSDSIFLSVDELQMLVKKANDMGHNGQRVLSVYVVSGTAATGTAFAWDTDRGPTSATQTWEQR